MAKKRTKPGKLWGSSESTSLMQLAGQRLLSPRRLRLLAIACCKKYYGQRGPWTGYSGLLQLAELMADCENEQRMSELSNQALQFRLSAYPHGVINLLNENIDRAIHEWTNLGKEVHGDALREIAGNPYAEINFDPTLNAWRDGAIPKLAQACYDSNDFSMIGILGDALEEAGCNESSILEHIRNEQNHFRGCWVIDLILGKK